MTVVCHFMNKLLHTRFGVVYLIVGLVICIAGATRIALWLSTPGDLGLGTLLASLSIGLGYDLITASYIVLPLIIYLALLPERIYRNRLHSWLLGLGLYATLYGLLFVALAEWLFWNEFESRFNFIAVDYLVYTHEVLGNIRESYPVPSLLSTIAVIAGLLFWPLRPWLAAAGPATAYRQRLSMALMLLTVPLLATLAVDSQAANFSSNRYANELAGNGIYDFFAAFRRNEIDYNRYYIVQNNNQVFAYLRALLAQPGQPYTSNDLHNITRSITGRGAEKRLNVVLITVESLSAEFLGRFGNTHQLTPNLDRLADESLLFTHVYATGTRTDRGLEALTLSVPPTAGRSIVKRPDNEQLFSLGQVFRERGYRTLFLYGGYGYFDNMNYFFSHNGYEVVDRNDIPEDAIHFANIWGVADEDLYTQALKEIDRTYASGKPFFGHLMTTSNHRPYTYPAGRIDIPSPGGREGVVKYTDYAIGDFIERARHKPWFDDTLFVIVADHCAKSAGKEALTAARYHIPLLIYAPQHISPGRIERTVSQIDIAPTLLGLLNFTYQSRFFGQDVLDPDAIDAERALIGNYQRLGYIKNDVLTVLSPKRQIQSYQLDVNQAQTPLAEPITRLVDDAVAYYQGASLLYQAQHAPKPH